MKNSIVFFVLTIIIQQGLLGQSHKLLEISQGKLTYSKVLRNLENDLLGYVFIFEKKSENIRNPDYEYVLLDSNLQVVTKQTHKNIRINFYTSEIQAIVPFGDSLMVYKKYCSASYCFSSYYYISTKRNFKSQEFVRSKDKIEPLILNKKSYKDYYKEYFIQGYYVISNGNTRYLIDPLFYEHKPDGSFILESISPENILIKDTIKYGIHNKNKDLRVEILLLTNSKLTILVSEYIKQPIRIGNSNAKLVSKFIQCIDLNTKKTLYSYPIELEGEKFLISAEALVKGNDIIYTGKYGEYIKNANDIYDKSLGLYYIQLNSDGKEVSKSFISWSKFDPNLRLKSDGMDKDGYQLRVLSSKILNNGSIIQIADHFKPEREGIMIPGISMISSLATSRSERSKDFVILNINKQLELESSKLLYTELTKGNDYDYYYTDYTKDKNGVISFYKDEIKEKGKGDFTLGIIKFINNKVDVDKVVISNPKSKKLVAIQAKKEYILIAEVDKDDNLIEMRLERVNL